MIQRAFISQDGSIEKLEYVSGPPLLMASAIRAVKEWKYRPTMLNGQPVEVDTTVQVVFSLVQQTRGRPFSLKGEGRGRIRTPYPPRRSWDTRKIKR